MSNPRAVISNIIAASKAAGIDLPATLHRAVEEAERVRHAVPDGDRRAVADAVAAAALAGRDVTTDKAVARALTAYQLAQALPASMLIDITEATRTQAFLDHADAILSALAVVVSEADTALAEARETLPALDLTDRDQASQGTPAQSLAWARARDAAARFEAAAACWSHLATLANVRNATPVHRALAVADLTLTEFTDLGHNPQPIDVLHAGHRLDLADFETFGERVARIAAERVRQGAAADQSAADAVQRRFGWALVGR